MSPPQSQHTAAGHTLRQTARIPRDSDGVGCALRQIFNGVPGMPSEFRALLGRLNDRD